MFFSKKACRIRLRPAFLLLAVFIPSLSSGQDQQRSAIRVEVTRVSVGVIATDKNGKFVEGLKQSDFHVFDDGIEQPISGFLANDDPAQVILMLECGPSVNLFGIQYVERAAALIRNLSPNDRVAIVCYSSAPETQVDLSEDKSAAIAALNGINFHAGFADLNLSKSLLLVIARLEKLQGKKTVVLLSSGIDSSPPVLPEEFRARLSSTDVRVLAIGTSRILTQPPKHHVRTRAEKAGLANLTPALLAGEERIREVASATGGRSYFPQSTKEFEKAFLEIAEIVRHEYNLAFVPQSLDGKLHTLSVTANHAVRLDHRQAYFAP